MIAERKNRDAWVMPFRSQEFSRGPELLQKSGRAALRLDYETRTGAYAGKSQICECRSDRLHHLAFLHA